MGRKIGPVIAAQSAAWQASMKSAGAVSLLASKDDVSPACLTAFAMAFHSALLSRVWNTKTLSYRVERAFGLADAHHWAVHVKGTPLAKFTLAKLWPVGRINRMSHHATRGYSCRAARRGGLVGAYAPEWCVGT
jgi:hypothetical protein